MQFWIQINKWVQSNILFSHCVQNQWFHKDSKQCVIFSICTTKKISHMFEMLRLCGLTRQLLKISCLQTINQMLTHKVHLVSGGITIVIFHTVCKFNIFGAFHLEIGYGNIRRVRLLPYTTDPWTHKSVGVRGFPCKSRTWWSVCRSCGTRHTWWPYNWQLHILPFGASQSERDLKNFQC